MSGPAPFSKEEMMQTMVDVAARAVAGGQEAIGFTVTVLMATAESLAEVHDAAAKMQEGG